MMAITKQIQAFTSRNHLYQQGIVVLIEKPNTMKTIHLLSIILLCVVSISYGQWPQTNLSEAKMRMAGATLGTKAYFAGGQVLAGSDWTETDKVEIYDIATGTWQMEQLTQPRVYASGVTCGDKVFFAGGINNFPFNPSSRVDIYDSQGFWNIVELIVPRFAISAVSNDSLVLFAGGATIITNESYDIVEIYNINSNEWSFESLSEPRGGMGCAVSGDLAFFAGGENSNGKTDRVDIYNFATRTWDTATLSLARTWIGAAAVGNKVLFAGGVLDGGALSHRVDIYNTETNTWEDTASLSMARGFFSQQVVTIGGYAYFVGGSGIEMDFDTIDVYNSMDESWCVMTMPDSLTDHTVVAIDTTMLIAGGFTITTPPDGNVQETVYIYSNAKPDCIGVGISAYQEEEISLKVYPNPSSGRIKLEVPLDDHHKQLLATIYNLQGQAVFSQSLNPGDKELNVNLTDGIYLLNIITDDAMRSELIAIQK
jgi:hypothetical protein